MRSREDQIRDVMYGMALGDAIGWPYEFETNDTIRSVITTVGTYSDKFEYTDDTQMAIAIALAVSSGDKANVYKELLNWLDTQTFPGEVRAPGITCMRSLRSGIYGTHRRRINNSRGNGTVMRAAPFAFLPTEREVFDWAVEDSFSTHGHHHAAFCAAFQAMLIHSTDPNSSYLPLERVFSTLNLWWSASKFQPISDDLYEDLGDVVTDHPNRDYTSSVGAHARKVYGAGTAEATLLMSLYAYRQFGMNYISGIDYCVLNDGDSDTYAAVYGAMMGALTEVKHPTFNVNMLSESDKTKLDEAVAKMQASYRGIL